MTVFLGYLILGLVSGSIYALIATGLVVTYTTTGVFNFAHGAIAMISAFTFWQLWQGWHINVFLSLILVLFVIAPAFGLLVERVLIRPLRGLPVDVYVVVTLGLLLALVGIAILKWSPNTPRSLPYLFNGNGFQAAGLSISYHQVVAALALVAATAGLRVLFRQARLGIAMRAVVDSPDLLAMAGGRPTQVAQTSWMLSVSLAALAGILVAPIVQLNIFNLTLIVVNGYAAAIIGRLRNLPITIAGAMAIAIGQNMAQGYLPSSGFLSNVKDIIPIAVLFFVLVILPQDRLRTASFVGVAAPKVASLRSSLGGSAGLIVATVVIAGTLSGSNQRIGIQGFTLGIALLSIVLVTGYGGMVSLCQVAFVGLGAYAMQHVGGSGGSLLGVVAAVALSAAVGAIIALPTLRLRGLYFALATFAFAVVMERAVFGELIGTGGAINVARVNLPGIPTQSDHAFLIFSSMVFSLCAVGVLALRRGPFGRRLVASNDSPAACVTLGVNVNSTKLIVFSASAGLAGLAGSLYGAAQGSLSLTNDLQALLSLVVLLLARVGGINTVTGALFGAFTYALFPVLGEHVPRLANAQYLLTGLAAISVGRDPNGFGGRIATLADQLRTIGERSRPVAAPAQPAAPQAGTAAAVFIAEEGDSLVGANN